ncbi:MAG: arsenate reductase family protein [Firmicutes bacterium]|nr:arsenate reductase family protein [Bacillota bacterium]
MYRYYQKGAGMLFIEYPKCTTCKKAKKHLETLGVEFEDRHIVEDNPTADELRGWIEKSGYPVKKFFNTSGMKYRELRLKDRLPEMTDDEKIDLLASDGMLVKRPLLITEDKVLVGFKEKEWEF